MKLITWGDGLSCERHVDAQNARANAETPLDRLEGLEPSPQEFHKRMLLMQVCAFAFLHKEVLQLDLRRRHALVISCSKMFSCCKM